MKNTRLILQLVLFLACLLVLPNYSFSMKDVVKNRATDLYVGSYLSVQSNTYLETDPNLQVESVTNKLTLHCDLDKSIYQPGFNYFTVKVEIKKYTISGTAMTVIDTTTLRINYDPAAQTTYVDKDVYVLSDAYMMEVKIIDIQSGLPGGALPATVYLEAEIEVIKHYPKTVKAASTLVQSTPTLNSTNELHFAWSDNQGINYADEYDLEWTYIDDYKDASGAFFPASSLSYSFASNASRVTIEAPNQNNGFSYDVAAIFSHGYVVYRVRPVSHLGFNRIEGTWSLPTQGTITAAMSKNAVYTQSATFQQAFNWHYNAEFAEGGRHKESVDYYDASLRKRQSVSQNNSTNDVIVQDFIYDHQGRLAVTTLPAPHLGVSVPTLRYYGGFSSNAGGTSYGRSDFDLDFTNKCTVAPQSMSKSTGASWYYSGIVSSQNTNSYIPDAGGYPFTQVEYSSDLSGKVRRQSGIGADHKLGSGHETKMFYVTPFQEELDRLFGSEVGLSNNYRKVMTQDANGQVSVAYKDANDKVIATAMVGPSPANLLPLSNNANRGLLVDLLKNNKADNAQKLINSTANFMVSSPQEYRFIYTLNKERFLNECAAVSKCYDCAYDLVISVRDECGTEMIPNGSGGTAPIKMTIEPLPYNNQCVIADAVSVPSDVGGTPAPPDLNKDFSVYLPLGQYSVTKTLYVNKVVSPEVVEQALADNTCLKTEQSFIDEEVAKIDFSGCNIKDDDCLGSLGTEEQFIANGGTKERYAELKAECESTKKETLPANGGYCNTYYAQMLMDVAPGGQYARYNTTTNSKGENVYSSSENLSVLNQNNQLFYGPDADWRHPLTSYKNAAGEEDRVVVDGVSYRPENLPTLTDFIRLYKSSWSESLVQFHPEYCYYRWCTLTETGRSFDQAMMQVNTYDEALAKGYINPLCMTNQGEPNSSCVNQDPFFANGAQGANYRIRMLAKMQDYPYESSTSTPRSIWWAASFFANCDYVNAKNTATGSSNACDKNINYQFGNDACVKDREWNMFKALYQTEKTKLYEEAREQYAIDQKCIDPCVIQTTSACPRYEALVAYMTNTTPPPSNTSSGASGCQSYAVLQEYQSKRKVFPSTRNMIATAPTNGGSYSASDQAKFDNEFKPAFTDPKVLDSCGCNKVLNFFANNQDCSNAEMLFYYQQHFFISSIDLTKIKTKCELAYAYCNAGLWQPGAEWCATAAGQLSQPDPVTQQPITIPAFLTCRISPYPYIKIDPEECRNKLIRMATQRGKEAYQSYIKEARERAYNAYFDACMAAKKNEIFTMSYSDAEYQYTLYYYDLVGNLMRTVPPQGVVTVPDDELSKVVQERLNHPAEDVFYYTHAPTISLYTGHKFLTTYRYQSLNQLIAQNTPDGGFSMFYYDRAGRLILSQNAKQMPLHQYSYTTYDKRNRIIETGQVRNTHELNNFNYYVETGYPEAGTPQGFLHQYTPFVTNQQLVAWQEFGVKSQITKTYYDAPLNTRVSAAFGAKKQTNLRGRVASVVYMATDPKKQDVYDNGIHYSYDIHGNVGDLVQESPIETELGKAFKKTSYTYDLISGKVLTVAYQKDYTDQFFHKYDYDLDNRLTAVYTSVDGVVWDKDASYSYYRHGALDRMTLGDNRVQGVDYAYTIQGWIKGVNSTSLASARDIGKDGLFSNTATRTLPKDKMGYSLSYFANDYKSAASASADFFDMSRASTAFGTRVPDLYNGNIARMVTTITDLNNDVKPMGRAFRYDQLNRLINAYAFEDADLNGNRWNPPAETGHYQETFSYDGNGNILTLVRNSNDDNNPTVDNLTYSYGNNNNQLTAVATSGNPVATGLYTYDPIGNLTSDVLNGIQKIDWNLQGKISNIVKAGTSNGSNAIRFRYDGMGNRILKGTYLGANLGVQKSDAYIRDASGNVMAIYQSMPYDRTAIAFDPGSLKYNVSKDRYYDVEYPIYGSDRIGTRKRHLKNIDALINVRDLAGTMLASEKTALGTAAGQLNTAFASINNQLHAAQAEAESQYTALPHDIQYWVQKIGDGLGMRQQSTASQQEVMPPFALTSSQAANPEMLPLYTSFANAVAEYTGSGAQKKTTIANEQGLTGTAAIAADSVQRSLDSLLKKWDGLITAQAIKGSPVDAITPPLATLQTQVDQFQTYIAQQINLLTLLPTKKQQVTAQLASSTSTIDNLQEGLTQAMTAIAAAPDTGSKQCSTQLLNLESGMNSLLSATQSCGSLLTGLAPTLSTIVNQKQTALQTAITTVSGLSLAARNLYAALPTVAQQREYRHLLLSSICQFAEQANTLAASATTSIADGRKWSDLIDRLQSFKAQEAVYAAGNDAKYKEGLTALTTLLKDQQQLLQLPTGTAESAWSEQATALGLVIEEVASAATAAEQHPTTTATAVESIRAALYADALQLLLPEPEAAVYERLETNVKGAANLLDADKAKTTQSKLATDLNAMFTAKQTLVSVSTEVKQYVQQQKNGQVQLQHWIQSHFSQADSADRRSGFLGELEELNNALTVLMGISQRMETCTDKERYTNLLAGLETASGYIFADAEAAATTLSTMEGADAGLMQQLQNLKATAGQVLERSKALSNAQETLLSKQKEVQGTVFQFADILQTQRDLLSLAEANPRMNTAIATALRQLGTTVRTASLNNPEQIRAALETLSDSIVRCQEYAGTSPQALSRLQAQVFVLNENLQEIANDRSLTVTKTYLLGGNAAAVQALQQEQTPATLPVASSNTMLSRMAMTERNRWAGLAAWADVQLPLWKAYSAVQEASTCDSLKKQYDVQTAWIRNYIAKETLWLSQLPSATSTTQSSAQKVDKQLLAARTAVAALNPATSLRTAQYDLVQLENNLRTTSAAFKQGLLAMMANNRHQMARYQGSMSYQQADAQKAIAVLTTYLSAQMAKGDTVIIPDDPTLLALREQMGIAAYRLAALHPEFVPVQQRISAYWPELAANDGYPAYRSETETGSTTGILEALGIDSKAYSLLQAEPAAADLVQTLEGLENGFKAASAKQAIDAERFIAAAASPEALDRVRAAMTTLKSANAAARAAEEGLKQRIAQWLTDFAANNLETELTALATQCSVSAQKTLIQTEKAVLKDLIAQGLLMPSKANDATAWERLDFLQGQAESLQNQLLAANNNPTALASGYLALIRQLVTAQSMSYRPATATQAQAAGAQGRASAVPGGTFVRNQTQPYTSAVVAATNNWPASLVTHSPAFLQVKGIVMDQVTTVKGVVSTYKPTIMIVVGVVNPPVKEILATGIIGLTPSNPPTYSYTTNGIHYLRELGSKEYELKNHLGNVLSVISDRKKPAGNQVEYNSFALTTESWGPYTPSGAVAVVSGRLRAACSANGAGTQKSYWTTPAKNYIFTVQAELPSTASPRFQLYVVRADNNTVIYQATLQQGINALQFTAASTITYIRIVKENDPYPTAARSMYVDGATLQESTTLFEADQLAANDYYAFGSLMPGRQFNSGLYRYGFNGQEKDDEVKGIGSSINYDARIYDPRLGRFLSVDPLTKEYPTLTPYQFASNTPIQAIDLDGLEAVAVVGGADLDSKGLAPTTNQITNDLKIYAKSQNINVNNIKSFNSNPLGLNVEKQAIKDFVCQQADAKQPIAIYAYSLGGVVTMNALKEIAKERPDIKIDLLITIDPALGPYSQSLEVPSNVKLNLNFYQTDESSINSRGFPNYAQDENKTDVVNMNQTGTVTENPGDAHGQMDEKNQGVSTNVLKKFIGENKPTPEESKD